MPDPTREPGLPATDPAEGWDPHECARFRSVSWSCYSIEDMTDAEGREFHVGVEAERERIADIVELWARNFTASAPVGQQRWIPATSVDVLLKLIGGDDA